MDNLTRALLVIDMQRGFDTACDPYVIRACTRAIRNAKKAGRPIIIVLYTPTSFGNFMLPNLVNNYEDIVYVYKRWDDGSKAIRYTLKNYDLFVRQFDVCGVNLGACVASTVAGLTNSENDDPIPCNILLDACNDEPISGGYRDLKLRSEIVKPLEKGLITFDRKWDKRNLLGLRKPIERLSAA